MPSWGRSAFSVRCGRPLVGECGWHPQVEDDEVWLGGRDEFDEPVGVAQGADDVVVLVGEQPYQAIP